MRRGSMILVAAAVAVSSVAMADNWPHWRGPRATGASAEKGLPVRWSDTENVVWKLAMPARSGSTPIIWDRHVFLNVGDGTDLWLWAVDRDAGTVLWKKQIGGENIVTRKQNMSSPSPVTDGKRVWVLTGTGVVKAFDFDGNELWTRDVVADHGKFGLNWGYASSPLLVGDLRRSAGAPRHEDRRSVVRARARWRDRRRALAGRAADRRQGGVARRLHHARAVRRRLRGSRSW